MNNINKSFTKRIYFFILLCYYRAHKEGEFMKSLYDYDFLQNEVFYRSEYILKYLERHKDISELDKEAIANTILDALVYKGLINPDTESLDFENLCIRDNLDHIRYNKTPNVTSIPQEIKEAMRHKSIIISGSIPISIFCAKPAGEVHTCIYDMNTAFSSLVSSFKFLICNYDSPTRPGVRATERPFVEVNINGEAYLVDTLTKRIFKSSWFRAAYNLEVIEEIASEDFDLEHQRLYQEQTTESVQLGSYYHLNSLFSEVFKTVPNMEESLFENERSKENYPDAVAEYHFITEDMRRLGLL